MMLSNVDIIVLFILIALAFPTVCGVVLIIMDIIEDIYNRISKKEDDSNDDHER